MAAHNFGGDISVLPSLSLLIRAHAGAPLDNEYLCSVSDRQGELASHRVGFLAGAGSPFASGVIIPNWHMSMVIAYKWG